MPRRPGRCTVGPVANAEHVERLRAGVGAWNAWRRENPSIRPDLSGEDLSELDLQGINLGETDLSDTELFQADLTEANLKNATLVRADLAGARLDGAALYKTDLEEACLIEADLTGASLASAGLRNADLRGAVLRETNLEDADLRNAVLTMADLTGANLTRADVTGADLRSANLDEANVTGLRHGTYRDKWGRYYGIRGLGSCFGNPLFVRDARDQDYLDALEAAIEETPSATSRRWKRFWFDAWGLIDHGRSLGKLALGATLVILAFGALIQLDAARAWHLFSIPGSHRTPLTPYYHSVVTFTRLGSAGITPTHWIGEVALQVERLLGYVTLALLLSILVNKVARRG